MKVRTLLSAALLAGGAGVAQASDHGCKVLLCLANPQGPMAVAECVEPIRKLYRDLARGRAFPGCSMASAPSGTPAGRSWAQYGVSFYDPCPPGTSALAQGALAAGGAGASSVYTGTGDGGDGYGYDHSSLPAKVCVGRPTGETWVNVGEGDGMSTVAVTTYDNIVVMQPVAQPYHADIYIDSAFSHRVRW
ncbi:hypothetical protein [Pseudoduganella chitinolytica]|uniref:Secreted protein n=1 Tax=Pseudoduganella chitinolytica TaxID=34070 RepID=A0ABY8B6A9_9BURK|nr:hypothetical protein [Pseudoduganella chitinolytica]WEF31472.1 hypothetical protein PX653_18665 [Pseudoduganella chitinolytica]